MRLLHTSDWHLGRSFHREDLLAAQASFLDHLVATVRSERVECVVVSGDVYDRALPPVDAVLLFNDALRRLVAEQVRVVLIAGNHDSAHRLGFAADLIDAAGVHLRTDPARVASPILVSGVAVYGIPYLEPELVRAPWDLAERSHEAALTAAMTRIRAAHRPGTPSVVLAHAFVTGGVASDSERDISVGGSSHVPASVFEGVGYAALGHLHGRQRITDRVRYSGSPLAYSFSETHQVKGCWLVDLAADNTPACDFVEAPVPRRLARLTGTLDDLLTSSDYERYTDHWLQVTLTDPQRPAAAMERLRRRFPHTLVLLFDPRGAVSADRPRAERLAGRSDLDIARDFLTEVTGAPPAPADQALLADAFQSCRTAEAVR